MLLMVVKITTLNRKHLKSLLLIENIETEFENK